MKLNLSNINKELGTTNQVVSNSRAHKIKFYADHSERGYKNRLFSFETANESTAIKLLVKFEDTGCRIRMAYLTPANEIISKKLSVPFDYKSFPLYKCLKSKD